MCCLRNLATAFTRSSVIPTVPQLDGHSHNAINTTVKPGWPPECLLLRENRYSPTIGGDTGSENRLLGSL